VLWQNVRCCTPRVLLVLNAQRCAEAVQITSSTCEFPGCSRPPYVDPTGVTHQCCGRTCAAALLVLNAQNQTSVGVEVPDIVIAETVSSGPSSSSASANAQSSWYAQTPSPQPPLLYGNGDYTELEEYGGSEHDTDDEGDGTTIVLLPRPISTTRHIHIPPKCYIYVMTTTGRQSWMRPGVYVGTQFGSDMLSDRHVGMRPPIAGQPACINPSS
jgi:hypothetical protein